LIHTQIPIRMGTDISSHEGTTKPQLFEANYQNPK